MSQTTPRWKGVFKQTNIADLVILTPFAIPFVADHYLSLWRLISETISADRPLGEFGPDAVLFVNLAGAFALLAVLVRMRLANAQAARMTGIFKLFAAAIFAIALMREASLVFAIPLIADLVLGALLLVTSRKP